MGRRNSKVPYIMMAVLAVAIAALLIYIVPYRYRVRIILYPLRKLMSLLTILLPGMRHRRTMKRSARTRSWYTLA